MFSGRCTQRFHILLMILCKIRWFERVKYSEKLLQMWFTVKIQSESWKCPVGKILFSNWKIFISQLRNYFFPVGHFLSPFWTHFCAILVSFWLFSVHFYPLNKIMIQVKIFDMSHWVSCRTLHATSLLPCYKTDFISRLSCVLQFTTHSRKRKYIRDSFGRTGDFC